MRYLGFIAIAFLFAACRNDHVTIPYHIGQDYEVIYSRPDNRTTALARFEKKELNASPVHYLLSGNESITFNGSSWTSAQNSIYDYEWNATGMTNGTFQLTNEAGNNFFNTILISDVQDIILDSIMDTIPSTSSFIVSFSPPVMSGETVYISFTQGQAYTEALRTTTAGDTSITFQGVGPTLSYPIVPGSVRILAQRSRSFPTVLSADGDAGGKRRVTKFDWRTVVYH